MRPGGETVRFCEIQPLLVDVDGRDLSRTICFCECTCEDADSADAQDKYALALTQTDTSARVYQNGQGLRQCCLLKGAIIG